MKWDDRKTYIELYPPNDFNYEECIAFLGRSTLEVLHQIQGKTIVKLLKIKEQLILLQIQYRDNRLIINFPNESPSESEREQVAKFVWEWFDLDTNLNWIESIAKKDTILSPLFNRYHGLRIMCIPDLFEALTWAVIGQQINLPFAYTLKKRFVEQFGESLTLKGETYWVYPTFEKIAGIEAMELRDLQFSMRKAEYIIGIATLMKSGNLSKARLQQIQEDQPLKEELMKIKGIGAWTADYVMMKCFHRQNAFPISDVGLHQALRELLGLNRKPTMIEIEDVSTKWEGIKGYATFYLWRSLYESTT